MTMLKSLKMSKKIKDTKILCLLGDPQRLPESNFKVQIIIRTNIFFSVFNLTETQPETRVFSKNPTQT
jgi:hypothetical protein